MSKVAKWQGLPNAYPATIGQCHIQTLNRDEKYTSTRLGLAQGQVAISPDQLTLVYSPTAVGQDRFTYTVSDGDLSNTTRVTLTVSVTAEMSQTMIYTNAKGQQIIILIPAEAVSQETLMRISFFCPLC